MSLGKRAKQYDRLGMVDEYTNIMGINVPSLTIPVKLGRNLAVIVEVASMNNRQKRMGYNAAVELNNRLMSQMESQLGNLEEPVDKCRQLQTIVIFR